MSSVKLDKDNGTVTIDRHICLVIPTTIYDIDSFLEWFQKQSNVTAHHTSLIVRALRKTIDSSDTFWNAT